MRLLSNEDAKPARVVRTDVPTRAVSQLVLRRRSPLRQTPADVVNDECTATGPRLPVVECRPVIEARYIVKHAVLAFAHRLVVGAHQVDMLERPPGVTLPECTEQRIRFAG